MAGSGRIDLGLSVEAPAPRPRGIAPAGNGRLPVAASHSREAFDALALPLGSGAAGRRQCVTLPCSAAVHAAAALALITVPLLVTPELPVPPDAIQAFFAQPMVVPPPPPPPPPTPAARTGVPPREPTPIADAGGPLTAPVEVPSRLRVEAGLDLGIEGGIPGGVAGGVPGGVLGGVVGGLPEAGAGVPPPVAPVRVGGLVKEPVRIRHVDPVYPKVAMAASVQGVVIIEVVIDAGGRIAEARVLRGVPMLDEAALEAVRQWEYTPTLLDGVPTPVQMTITITFRLERPSTG